MPVSNSTVSIYYVEGENYHCPFCEFEESRDIPTNTPSNPYEATPFEPVDDPQDKFEIFESSGMEASGCICTLLFFAIVLALAVYSYLHFVNDDGLFNCGELRKKPEINASDTKLTLVRCDCSLCSKLFKDVPPTIIDLGYCKTKSCRP